MLIHCSTASSPKPVFVAKPKKSLRKKTEETDLEAHDEAEGVQYGMAPH
jgi:hypothetical protein